MTAPRKDTAPENDRLAYSIPHAAAQLDCSPRTVWGLIQRGDLHAVRIGRRVVIARSELVRFLRSGSNGNAVQP